jgi:hypothetical protein
MNKDLEAILARLAAIEARLARLEARDTYAVSTYRVTPIYHCSCPPTTVCMNTACPCPRQMRVTCETK